MQQGLQQRGFRLAVRLLLLALQAGGASDTEEHVALALQAIKMQLNEVRAGYGRSTCCCVVTVLSVLSMTSTIDSRLCTHTTCAHASSVAPGHGCSCSWRCYSDCGRRRSVTARSTRWLRASALGSRGPCPLQAAFAWWKASSWVRVVALCTSRVHALRRLCGCGAPALFGRGCGAEPVERGGGAGGVQARERAGSAAAGGALPGTHAAQPQHHHSVRFW